MELITRSSETPSYEIGPLGWFALAGFLSMNALYFVDVMAEGSSISPVLTLSIGILAGIGFLLCWIGTDRTSRYRE